MQVAVAPEDDPRRLEVRAWLAGHPQPTGEQLARAGYVAPHWPRPWGLEADPVHQLEGDGWRLAKVTLGNERVSLSGEGSLWGSGPSAFDLVDLVRERGGATDGVLRQRLAALHAEAVCLQLIRYRTLAARLRGEAPGPEASVRKALADDHGQRVMGLAQDLCGPAGMLTDAGPVGAGADARFGSAAIGLRTWHLGFLFSPALTIGGGTAEVQRNIIAEQVLGQPHDADADSGLSWSEARGRARGAVGTT